MTVPVPIPVTTIGGYLGAGKTTFINELLRSPDGRRVAVLVNDFGGINIDASLIASMGATTIALTNGCACCVLGNDLGEAFDTVANASPRFDAILVEASGVADPRKMAEWANLPGLRSAGVLVLADVATVVERLDDPLLGRTIRRQLQGAHTIALTKADLVSGEVSDQVVERIGSLCPVIPVTVARPADPWALVALVDASSHRVPGGEAEDGDHEAVHVSYTVQLGDSVVADDLVAFFSRPSEGLARAKGFVSVAGEKRLMVLQVAGTAAHVSLSVAQPESHSIGAVVVIGIDGVFDIERFRRQLTEARLAL
jgi:G3E family GTPase